jgi:heme-degrading monooxygenase HmoA
MILACTPKPPYYAVIFTSVKANDDPYYGEMAKKMIDLSAQQDGFLGVDSAREEIGITVSYWQNLEAIKNWKENVDHMEARKKGKTDWYTSFKVRIAAVEKEYGFEKK